MAVGHEYCGEIVEMGSEVRGLKLGDRVSGEGHVTCGFCRNCRAGAGICAATPSCRGQSPRLLCRIHVAAGIKRVQAYAGHHR